uniref:Uncharacterized protein n=1 Tax=Salix viminalis TaxID=40686 RepID=A0A6N2KEH2_SALVM
MLFFRSLGAVGSLMIRVEKNELVAVSRTRFKASKNFQASKMCLPMQTKAVEGRPSTLDGQLKTYLTT